MTGRKRLTRAQKQELLYSPIVQAEMARDPHVQQARALYHEDGEGLLAELAELGYDVEGVGEMRRRNLHYRDAVPTLLRWLPQVRYLPLVEDIIRGLSVSFARDQAVPVFLKLFEAPPEVADPMRPVDSPVSPREHLRWVIGNGLGIHASPAIADDLIRLAQDRRYGQARSQIVMALPKTKSEKTIPVLIAQLDDPTVASSAIETLGKMKAIEAIPLLEPLRDHHDKNIRDQTKKALRRLTTTTK